MTSQQRNDMFFLIGMTLIIAIALAVFLWP
ncbi:nitrogen fixation-related uncharacterized protein [Bradyrhizobium barranii subsp. barranii]|nr:nitrogen fixation-related uncharacterized protein [Bradyrhizobium japonicum]MCP1958169.1 nitrogen fixation-related uncharacterized protein [Bradyrhizobium japonicum]